MRWQHECNMVLGPEPSSSLRRVVFDSLGPELSLLLSLPTAGQSGEMPLTLV